jgi:aspartate/glutamate racemase
MKKKIGIIGGAGPMASRLLYKKIIQECQQNYGCKDDADFSRNYSYQFPF